MLENEKNVKKETLLKKSLAKFRKESKIPPFLRGQGTIFERRKIYESKVMGHWYGRGSWVSRLRWHVAVI